MTVSLIPTSLMETNTIATLALMLYEYAITIDREVILFWKGKKTMAWVLFVANRYLSLLYHLVLVIPWSSAYLVSKVSRHAYDSVDNQPVAKVVTDL